MWVDLAFDDLVQRDAQADASQVDVSVSEHTNTEQSTVPVLVLFGIAVLQLRSSVRSDFFVGHVFVVHGFFPF